MILQAGNENNDFAWDHYLYCLYYIQIYRKSNKSFRAEHCLGCASQLSVNNLVHGNGYGNTRNEINGISVMRAASITRDYSHTGDDSIHSIKFISYLLHFNERLSTSETIQF